MADAPQIVVLNHRNDEFWSINYLLKLLMAEWERQGFDVSVVRGPRERVDASIAILHVNLTRIPRDYLRYTRRHPIAINGDARDISKRVVADHRLRCGPRHGDAVIVKTDRNFGGLPELWMGTRRPLLDRVPRIARRLPWSWSGRLQPAEYPVFESARDVPLSVWLNRRLVVQKFQPEKRDGYYCLRNWVFFGDRDLGVLSLSKDPIVKSDNIVHRERIDTVPEELHAMRRRLGFDYGKFDYGIVEGRVVLYDANRTPTYSGSLTPDVRALVADLASGIHSFIDRD
jgi:hypothetical protein